MYNSKNAMLACVIGLTLSTAIEAFACGESLYRVGRGVGYRVYSAPLPGNVLVYIQSESDFEMAQNLADSGHGVQVVRKLEELEYKLNNSEFDVVIAPFSANQTITTNQFSAKWKERFLPIAESETEEDLARSEYAQVVRDGDSIKQYLKAIHRKLRSA